MKLVFKVIILKAFFIVCACFGGDLKLDGSSYEGFKKSDLRVGMEAYSISGNEATKYNRAVYKIICDVYGRDKVKPETFDYNHLEKIIDDRFLKIVDQKNRHEIIAYAENIKSKNDIIVADPDKPAELRLREILGQDGIEALSKMVKRAREMDANRANREAEKSKPQSSAAAKNGVPPKKQDENKDGQKEK